MISEVENSGVMCNKHEGFTAYESVFTVANSYV